MDDLISRQAAIDALDRIFDQCEEIEAHLPEGDPDRTGYKMYPDYMTVWKYLHQLPSAQPERKKGKWIIKDNPGTGWYRVVCSECGEDVTSVIPMMGDFPNAKALWNFCPDCGADMRGEKNEPNNKSN